MSILAMWPNDFEFGVIWTAFQLLLKLHSHISVLWPFCRISVIFKFSYLGIGLKTKTRKSRKILIFGFNILTLLSTKTEIYKYEFNLINLDGLEALKKQLTVTWLGIWLNHIEMYVIWRISQLFLKPDSHISVLGCFCRISVISEFSFLGIGLTTKLRKLRKNFIFRSIKFQCM